VIAVLTVVLGSLGDNHHISSLDLLLLSSNDGLANARSEDEVLVDAVNLTLISGSYFPPNQNQLTSSPISPPTGTVITTNCELSPVQRTVLKSGYCEGKALIA